MAEKKPFVRGFTFIEVIVTLVILVIMMGGGAAMISRYGARGRVKYEANKLVDELWELRADATVGQHNPCIDFPDSFTVRLYTDVASSPNGFGTGDSVRSTYTYAAKVQYSYISGGGSANHYVCFDSRGVKSGTSILKVRLKIPTDTNTVLVQLNPATSIARIVQ